MNKERKFFPYEEWYFLLLSECFFFSMLYLSTIQDQFLKGSASPKIWYVKDQAPKHIPLSNAHTQTHIT